RRHRSWIRTAAAVDPRPVRREGKATSANAGETIRGDPIMLPRQWRVASLVLALSAGGCSVPTFLTTHRENEPSLRSGQTADVQIGLGQSLEKSGSLEQAIEVYQEALKRDSARADAMDRLGVLYAQLGRFDEAVQMHQKATAAQPRNADFHCNAGYSYFL